MSLQLMMNRGKSGPAWDQVGPGVRLFSGWDGMGEVWSLAGCVWIRVGDVVCVYVPLSCIDLWVSLFGGCVLKGFSLPSQASLHIFVENF